MSVSRFISEPDEVIEVGQAPITTAGALLNHLRIAREPHDVRRAAVAAWLTENDADELLLETLRDLKLVD